MYPRTAPLRHAGVSTGARRYPGQRALRIALRTAHIGCAACTLGAAQFGAEAGWWPAGLVLTGAGIVGDDLYRYGADWLRFVQGQVVLLKLGLVTLGAAVPSLLLPCLWTALILGGVISHAPGRIRQAALWGPPGPCAERGRGAAKAASTASPGTNWKSPPAMYYPPNPAEPSESQETR
ncbi:MAG: hypothetical protein H6739_35950 [Alphaproteobacteria bacterium]|nr:hypothetical protein [Alphaproteobacteria bacterium]